MKAREINRKVDYGFWIVEPESLENNLLIVEAKRPLEVDTAQQS